LFGNPDKQLAELTEKIEALTRNVAALKGEKAAATEELGLSTRVVELQREKVTLEIELDRVKEKHAREKREIDHKLGLHRKQVDVEVDLAKREQVVAIREEALTQQQTRFEEEMNFMRDRMQGEIDRVSALTSEILEWLPVVKVDRHIRELVGGGNGNGHREDPDDE
jgi:hypothetical protein